MAGLSLLSNSRDSQLRAIHVAADETMDEDGNVVRDQSVDDSDAVMEDLNFIMFGDMGGIDTAKGLEIATIHWSKSKLFSLVRLEVNHHGCTGYRTLCPHWRCSVFA